MTPFSKTTALAALLAVPFAAATLPSTSAAEPPAAQEDPLGDRDLKKVASAIAEWLEARKEGEGYSELQEDVEKEFERPGKKLGGDGKSVDALLTHPWSLARAVWLAKDYDKKASKQRKLLGKVTDQSLTFKGLEANYSLWLPGKYKPKDGPYPVLITIPDEGVKPEEHIMEQWVDGSIRDRFILAAPKMPGNAGEWESMQGGVAAILLTLRDVRENYAIDYDRIFIGGRGRGAEIAHYIANNYIENFAGYFAWAGDAHPDAKALNFRNTACYFAGGGSNATAFQEAAKEAGMENVTAKQDGKSVDIANWAAEIKRDPYAPHVTIVQSKNAPTNFNWLQIERYPSETGLEEYTIDAKIDRDTNTITIEADGVTSATIYLSHAVLDLDKGITIIANGTELDKFSERPSMTRALEWIYGGRNDGSRFFVTSREFAIPARASEDGAGSGEGE